MDLYWRQVKMRGLGLGDYLGENFAAAWQNNRNQSWPEDLHSWPEMQTQSHYIKPGPAKPYRTQIKSAPEQFHPWNRENTTIILFSLTLCLLGLFRQNVFQRRKCSFLCTESWSHLGYHTRSKTSSWAAKTEQAYVCKDALPLHSL